MGNNMDIANTTPKRALHVLYHSSNMYAIPTGVSIYSLLKNNSAIEELHLHVINDGIANETVLKIERIAAQFGRKIEWIDGKALADDMERCNLPKFRNTYTSYMKIFAPNIILKAYPNAKNLLYIDSDTVVVGSLKDIPDMDLHENVLAGVYELSTLNELKRVGNPNYLFNCGITLFNLHNWNKNKCEETIKEKISDVDFAKRLLYAEQDVFNMLYPSLIQKLPMQYNVITPQFFLRPLSKYACRFHVSVGYTDEEADKAIEQPIILHYIDYWTGKPWDEPNANPISEIYYRYKNEVLPNETVASVKIKRGIFRKAAKGSAIWLISHVNPKITGEFMFLLMFLTSILPGRQAPISYEKHEPSKTNSN